jgi:hypothetical protein
LREVAVLCVCVFCGVCLCLKACVPSQRPYTSDGTVPPQRKLYSSDSPRAAIPTAAVDMSDDDTPKIKCVASVCTRSSSCLSHLRTFVFHSRVCVRKRPLNGAEKRRKDPDVVECVSRSTLRVYESKWVCLLPVQFSVDRSPLNASVLAFWQAKSGLDAIHGNARVHV